MRFDLEIPNSNIDLMYIPEGIEIPNGAISTYFVSIDDRNSLPSDMLSMEENIIKNPFAGYAAMEVRGPNFIVNSDQFFVTHAAKYISSLNAKVPLFFKYTIYGRVQEDAIKIYDYYGAILSDDEYLIEQNSIKSGVVYTDVTYIYMNQQDRIMFIEYSDGSGLTKKLLNLEPIFSEAKWDDLVAGEDLPQYKYTIANSQVDTSYNGIMYVLYKYKTNMVKMPIANIEDPWYVSIRNASFTLEDHDQTLTYRVPEYYLQHSFSSQKTKLIQHNKCKKVFSQYVQLQAPPSKDKLDQITIFVENYYTKVLNKVFTTNQALIGRNYPQTNLTYEAVLDLSYDGVVNIPYNFSDEEVVYATYHIDDDYYEFRLVDFSTALLTHGGYFTLFMLPNTSDSESSVYCATIGVDDKRSKIEKLGIQGVSFKSMEQYDEFIQYHAAYHLATIAISAAKQREIITLHDARRIGGEPKDKYALCLDSSDMAYQDIMSRKIKIPARDCVLAVFDSYRMNYEGAIKIDALNYTLDDKSKVVIDNIYSTIQKNLDVSTGLIFEFRLNCNIPPAKIISVVEGTISSITMMSATETTGV